MADLLLYLWLLIILYVMFNVQFLKSTCLLYVSYFYVYQLFGLNNKIVAYDVHLIKNIVVCFFFVNIYIDLNSILNKSFFEQFHWIWGWGSLLVKL